MKSRYMPIVNKKVLVQTVDRRRWTLQSPTILMDDVWILILIFNGSNTESYWQKRQNDVSQRKIGWNYYRSFFKFFVKHRVCEIWNMRNEKFVFIFQIFQILNFSWKFSKKWKYLSLLLTDRFGQIWQTLCKQNCW